jgi:hypothetical protein
LPKGHWHCPHGHLIDCPRPWECRPIDEGDEPITYAVLVGRRVWLFASESLAASQLKVLTDGGADGVRYRRGLSSAQVQALLSKLPEGVTVEDCR